MNSERAKLTARGYIVEHLSDSQVAQIWRFECAADVAQMQVGAVRVAGRWLAFGFALSRLGENLARALKPIARE